MSEDRLAIYIIFAFLALIATPARSSTLARDIVTVDDMITKITEAPTEQAAKAIVPKRTKEDSRADGRPAPHRRGGHGTLVMDNQRSNQGGKVAGHIIQHYNNEADIGAVSGASLTRVPANPVAVARTLFAASSFATQDGHGRRAETSCAPRHCRSALVPVRRRSARPQHRRCGQGQVLWRDSLVPGKRPRRWPSPRRCGQGDPR